MTLKYQLTQWDAKCHTSYYSTDNLSLTVKLCFVYFQLEKTAEVRTCYARLIYCKLENIDLSPTMADPKIQIAALITSGDGSKLVCVGLELEQFTHYIYCHAQTHKTRVQAVRLSRRTR